MCAKETVEEGNQPKAIAAYLLAASEDMEVCLALKKHLAGIIRNSAVPIAVQSDFDIPAGHDIQAYRTKLYEAEIVVALITSDFIANDECFDRAKKVIERYNRHQTKLLPVLARNYNWKSSQFKNLSLFPRNEQPINNKQYWNSEDDALTAVAGEVYSAINSYNLKESDEQANATRTPLSDKSELIVKIKKLWQKYTDQRKTVGEEEALSAVAKEIMEVITSYNLRSEIKGNWRRRYFLNAIGRRGSAYLLDFFVTTFVTILVFYALYGIDPDLFEPESNDIWGHLLIYGFPVLVLVLICAGYESSKWQGTFGKIILRMQTTDFEGNRIRFWRAVWRNCLRFVFGGMWVLLILEYFRYNCLLEKGADAQYGIIFLLFLLTLVIQLIYLFDTKKVIHDVISGTAVGEKLAKAEKRTT